jgi:hypothetical protein
MKKRTVLGSLLALALALPFIGCTDEPPVDPPAEKWSVVTDINQLDGEWTFDGTQTTSDEGTGLTGTTTVNASLTVNAGDETYSQSIVIEVVYTGAGLDTEVSEGTTMWDLVAVTTAFIYLQAGFEEEDFEVNNVTHTLTATKSVVDEPVVLTHFEINEGGDKVREVADTTTVYVKTETP